MIPLRGLAFVTLAFAGAVVADRQGAARPPRPALEPGQDTNSADAYYALGVSQLPDHPKLAGDAFFWATRIDPSNGAAWYGRWAAHLLDPDTPPVGVTVLPWVVDITNPEDQDPDSLRSYALLRDPLLYLRFDFMVGDELMRRDSHQQMNLYQTDDPSLLGMIDYNAGRFEAAARDFANGLRRHPGFYILHVERARAFAMESRYDSATYELRTFITAAPHYIEHRRLGPDVSIAVERYALGRIEEMKGDVAAAHAEYEALAAADSGFAPAHTGLARLALARHDTVTALAELGRAARGADAPARYDYGMLLLRAGRTGEAATQLARAIEADSDYLPPYYSLGVIEESAGFDSEAVALYAHFVAGAPRALAPAAEAARRRLAHLQGGRGSH